MMPLETRPRRYWTEQEDRVLQKEASLQIATKGSVSDWNRIASSLFGRTNKDCRKRWTKIGGSVNRGQWTSEEDERLRNGVDKHGHCWALVAQTVQTRHADQCAKRWLHFLDPELSHESWSSSEDERLMEAIRTYGTSWKVIIENDFPNRSATNIRNRYIVLKRRQKNEQASACEPDDYASNLKTLTDEYPVNDIGLQPSDPNVTADVDVDFLFSQEPLSTSLEHAPAINHQMALCNFDDLDLDPALENSTPGFANCVLDPSLMIKQTEVSSGLLHEQHSAGCDSQDIATNGILNPDSLGPDSISDRNTRYTLVLEDLSSNNLHGIMSQLLSSQIPVNLKITTAE